MYCNRVRCDWEKWKNRLFAAREWERILIVVSIGKRETYAGVRSLVLTEEKKEEGGHFIQPWRENGIMREKYKGKYSIDYRDPEEG